MIGRKNHRKSCTNGAIGQLRVAVLLAKVSTKACRVGIPKGRRTRGNGIWYNQLGVNATPSAHQRTAHHYCSDTSIKAHEGT